MVSYQSPTYTFLLTSGASHELPSPNRQSIGLIDERQVEGTTVSGFFGDRKSYRKG